MVAGGALGSVTVSYGRGIPREERRFRGKRKRELKKIQGKRGKRAGGGSDAAEGGGRWGGSGERECCFDVKGDGWAVVRRARGRERKIKEKGVKGEAGGEDRRQSRPQTVSSK